MTHQSFDPPFPNAAIDIGTNSIKLLIGSIDNGNLSRVLKKRVVTRLGRSLSEYGMLDNESFSKSVDSLIAFNALAQEYNSRKVTAVGTSALRDAGNSQEFLQAVKQKTGLDILIISGEMEADLTVRGVLSYKDSPPAPAFITDIGGGSTEWTIGGLTDKTKSGSIQIGAVRLYEQFIRKDPPAPEEIISMKKHIIDLVSSSFLVADIKSDIDKKIACFVATGGTAATVAAIDIGLETYDSDKIHLHRISFNRIKEIYEHLSSISLQERVKVKGLEPDRADIIISGMTILITMMEMLHTDALIVSDYGLLEGLLCDMPSTLLPLPDQE